MSLTILLSSRYEQLKQALPDIEHAAGAASELPAQSASAGDERLFESAAAFLELLAHWNKAMDLVAPDIVDSMAAGILIERFRPIPPGRAMLDVGSGAGLPGIILALLLPGRRVFLCEPREKRAYFLREAKRVLGLENTEVLRNRVEELATVDLGDLALITVRAVGKPELMMAHGVRLLEPGGSIVQLSGPNQSPLPAPKELKLEHEIVYDLGNIETPRKLFIWKCFT
jgi:16S rRNA (guanine527-N7)-methyltransferase